MRIGTLYDCLNNCKGMKLYAVVENNKKIRLSGQYYITDNEVYWYKANENESTADPSAIISMIEHEAEYDCWNPKGFRSRNTYEDCKTYIVNETSDVFDEFNLFEEIIDIFYDEDAVYLMCESE